MLQTHRQRRMGCRTVMAGRHRPCSAASSNPLRACVGCVWGSFHAPAGKEFPELLMADRNVNADDPQPQAAPAIWLPARTGEPLAVGREPGLPVLHDFHALLPLLPI